MITDSLRFAEIVEEKGSRVGQTTGARGCRRIDKVLGRTLRRFGVHVVLVDFSDGLLCVFGLSRCGDGGPDSCASGRRLAPMAPLPGSRTSCSGRQEVLIDGTLPVHTVRGREEVRWCHRGCPVQLFSLEKRRNSYARASPHRIVVVIRRRVVVLVRRYHQR